MGLNWALYESLSTGERREALHGYAGNAWCLYLKDVERSGQPQHFLDAVLCACRQQAEKLICSPFLLSPCVFHTPLCIVPPARSLLKLFAFEWLRSCSCWWVAVLNRAGPPKVSPPTPLLILLRSYPPTVARMGRKVPDLVNSVHNFVGLMRGCATRAGPVVAFSALYD